MSDQKILEEELQVLYENLGGDYLDVKDRLNNPESIRSILLLFPEDDSYEKLIHAVRNKDITMSFQQVHALKGVAANLGFTELYEASSNLCEQLRPREQEADPELLRILQKSYEKTMNAIQEYIRK